MKRFKLIVEFDGTHYSGVQVQGKGERTIGGELEAAAQHLGPSSAMVMCGRTDAGVHALAMPFHYSSATSVSADKLPYALNAFLPPDIRVLHALEVDDTFHARRSCHWREYRYRILQRRTVSALDAKRVWWVPQTLNVVPIRHALELLEGQHDFKAFSIKEDKSTVRRIYSSSLHIWPTDQGKEIWLSFVGNGFLRGQVRSMVGTLVEVGLGKRDSGNIIQLLNGGTRSQAAATAPAHGLYFVGAGYAAYPQQ